MCRQSIEHVQAVTPGTACSATAKACQLVVDRGGLWPAACQRLLHLAMSPSSVGDNNCMQEDALHRGGLLDTQVHPQSRPVRWVAAQMTLVTISTSYCQCENSPARSFHAATFVRLLWLILDAHQVLSCIRNGCLRVYVCWHPWISFQNGTRSALHLEWVISYRTLRRTPDSLVLRSHLPAKFALCSPATPQARNVRMLMIWRAPPLQGP